MRGVEENEYYLRIHSRATGLWVTNARTDLRVDDVRHLADLVPGDAADGQYRLAADLVDDLFSSGSVLTDHELDVDVYEYFLEAY